MVTCLNWPAYEKNYFDWVRHNIQDVVTRGPVPGIFPFVLCVNDLPLSVNRVCIWLLLHHGLSTLYDPHIGYHKPLQVSCCDER
jgi:hypothetical protein